MNNQSIFQGLWEAPGSQRGWFQVTRNGIAFRGLDHAELSILNARNVPGLGVVLMIHEKGRQYWAARGMQRYAGASYTTIIVEESERTLNTAQYRYVVLNADIPVKSDASLRDEKTALYVERLLDPDSFVNTGLTRQVVVEAE